MKTSPLGNNVLIEIEREYEGVSRADSDEGLSKGKVVAFSMAPYHLTASSAVRFHADDTEEMYGTLESLVGTTVRWEQFAEGGQTFTEDGKLYALVPWWRLISVEMK